MSTKLDLFRPWAANPWREFASLQRRMDRLFDEFSGSSLSTGPKGEVVFFPACDVEENDNQFLISMDVPGIPKDQIKVEIRGNTLTISGEHHEEKTQDKKKQMHYERYHGRFERSFTIPGLNAEKVEANYKDGVLQIAVAKDTTGQARRVQIGEGEARSEAKAQPKSEEKKETKQAETRAA